MTWTSIDAKRLMEDSGCDHPLEAIGTIVSALLTEAEQVMPPVELRLVASFRRVKRIDEVRMAQAGRIRFDRIDQCCLIEVNTDHTSGRKRFSAAHEIVHTLMPSWRIGDEMCDDETGMHLHASWTQLKEYQEREFLCDYGAAQILYPRNWFNSAVDRDSVTISGIRRLADSCGSSLDSAAFQLTQHCTQPLAVVMWELGLRKEDRPKIMMPSLPGFSASPVHKYRVARVYPSSSFRDGGVYIPHNKSVPMDSIVARSEVEGITSGRIRIDIGSREAEFQSENYFAPYGQTGRIISVLRMI